MAAMQQGSPPQQAQGAPQSQSPMNPGEAQQEGDPKEQALMQLVMQTDQGIVKLAQVIAQQNPQAGKALAALDMQFRQIVKAAMGQEDQQEQGQPPQKQAPGMAPAETGGRPSQPAL